MADEFRPTKPWYTSLQTWLGFVLIILPFLQEILEYLAKQDFSALDANQIMMIVAGVIAIVLRAKSKGEKVTL